MINQSVEKLFVIFLLFDKTATIRSFPREESNLDLKPGDARFNTSSKQQARIRFRRYDYQKHIIGGDFT